MLNRYKITKCQFSINTSTSYSSARITSPITFDNFGHINPNGLYDLRLGPLNITQFCQTCSQNITKCPSHFGHIELKMPVLNPLTIDTLLLLLNAICTNCHLFRHDLTTIQKLINISGIDSFDVLNAYLEEHTYNLDINTVIDFLKESGLKCAHCNSKILRYKIDKTKTISQKKVLCVEYLHTIIAKSYNRCKQIYNLLFNYEFDPKNFFLYDLPVLPNKFRPVNVINGRMYENGINSTYVKILKMNERSEFKKIKDNDEETNKNTNGLNDDLDNHNNNDLDNDNIYDKDIGNDKDNNHIPNTNSITNTNNNQNLTNAVRNLEGYIIDPVYLNNYILLQRYVYLIFDSSIRQKNEISIGIKQILEKKEGLFRKNMMGKRVNFSARSVISPDPNLHTREIGIPDIFASKFTYPERITNYNIEKYRNEINTRSIPKITINNVTYDTSFLTDIKLYELSCKLNCGSICYRNMRDNDVVLVNRQPTLHKPSIMAHRVKVLKNEKTIRMHYANCNSYNADFDGDEMNIHFLQDEISRAEGYLLMSTDNNYCLESPVRGLVQDHISVMVRTCQSYFYDISNFIVEMNNTKVDECKFDTYLKHETRNDEESDKKYYIPVPCLVRPVKLYSGLQIVTAILKSMNMNIDFTSKCKIDASEVIVRDGHLLKGIIDKNQIGPTKNGLIHFCGLKYGMSVCNELLTTFGRVMNKIMISDGFSARIDDLLLIEEGNKNRKENIEEGKINGLKTGIDELCNKIKSERKSEDKSDKKRNGRKSDGYDDCEEYNDENTDDLNDDRDHNESGDELKNDTQNTQNRTNSTFNKYRMKNPYYFKDTNITAHLDSITKKEMNKTTSNIISSITDYQQKKQNNFTTMILSGAKGSLVNLGQISGLLGQQELEGKRPPLMESNTTLPSVKSNSLNPQDYGFIFDRFADGIDSNSYFFHCMAGREGLIDTAVKTARSGYLQRCLVKTLEDCRVENDLSVRMNGLIVQFRYGEDGLDPVQINSYQDNITCEGEVSEHGPVYVTPGEAVGIIAAQSVGEPSTQMTLNTFHLAGVGSKNVTLGIPRLVEIIMVAQKNIKTPYTTVELKGDFDIGKLKRVTLNDVVDKITIEECRNEYKIKIETESSVSKSVIKKIVNLLDKLSKKKKIVGIEAKEEVVEEVEEHEDVHESESSSEELSDAEEKVDHNDASIVDDESDADETIADEKVGDVFDEVDELRNAYEQGNNQKISYAAKENGKSEEKKKDQTKCLSFTYTTTQKDILILPYLEKIMPLITIKQWPGVKSASVQDNKLTIEGSELKSLVDLLSSEELNTMYTNDIYYISQFLGIEAARNAIIEEITNVFDVYGISINIRHLMLIADMMTRDGCYKPCSRNGMKDKSIIQRMCFESCYSYLKKGVVFDETDYVNNVSSELVLGRNVSMGTQGCFDLLYELPDE